jgi:hypothetical protein
MTELNVKNLIESVFGKIERIIEDEYNITYYIQVNSNVRLRPDHNSVNIYKDVWLNNEKHRKRDELHDQLIQDWF